MDDILTIEQLVAAGCLQEAIDRLGTVIDSVSGSEVASGANVNENILADLYFRRGKLLWRLGKRAAATSDYARASALNPTSSAVKALEQARAVADFFNPDLYNP